MTKEMEFFTFLMEQYAHYKNITADKILHQLDELNLTDYVFGMYEITVSSTSPLTALRTGSTSIRPRVLRSLYIS